MLNSLCWQRKDGQSIPGLMATLAGLRNLASGGEGGIRTHYHPLESVTSRFYIPQKRHECHTCQGCLSDIARQIVRDDFLQPLDRIAIPVTPRYRWPLRVASHHRLRTDVGQLRVPGPIREGKPDLTPTSWSRIGISTVLYVLQRPFINDLERVQKPNRPRFPQKSTAIATELATFRRKIDGSDQRQ
jgi:hypothetical protein